MRQLNIRGLETNRADDLRDFSQYLFYQRLNHRISEEGEKQVVWVDSDDAALALPVLYEKFQCGEIETKARPVPSDHNRKLLRSSIKTLVQSPLTLTIVLANILVFPVSLSFLEGGDLGNWLSLLTFSDFLEIAGRVRFADLGYTLQAGEWWRLVSPMVIHFGWLHLVFNLLWTWEIGRRIEIRSGGLMLILVVLMSSLIANLTQYGLYGVGLFGGMSGVVFGLLGYSLVWSQRLPARDMGIQRGIYIFMLVYLAIGFTGAIDLLGLGSIANGAHLGGLFAGVFLGWIATEWQLKIAK